MLNGILVDQKHAWNSARKFARDIVRSRLANGETAEITESHYVKDDSGLHESGIEIWKTSSGNKFEINIIRCCNE